MDNNLLLFLAVLAVSSVGATKYNITCNRLEVPLSNLTNAMNLQNIPPDFENLAENFNESHAITTVQGCSYILTFYNHTFIRFEVQISERYYTALYSHIVVRNENWRVETQSNSLFSMNSYSSTNLDSNYGTKLFDIFVDNKKWLPLLMSRHFRFDKSAWSKLLIMNTMCTLINGFDFNHGLPFLMNNTYICPFLNNENHKVKEITSETSSYDSFMDELNNASNISYVENVYFNKTVELNDASIYNRTISENILKNITFGDDWNRFNAAFILSSNTTVEMNEQKALGNDKSQNQIRNTLDSINDEITVIPENNYVTSGPGTLVYKHSHKKSEAIFDEKDSDILATTLPVPDDLENYGTNGWYMDNLNIRDVVQMDGPCKNGQHHVVKLDVHSLLTAIDNTAPQESVELFQKLVPMVKSFPIEDYNGRGDIVRDLLGTILQEESDPIIKEKIRKLLEYVLLIGPGVLPPKIKLLCEDVSQFEEKPGKIQRGDENTFYVEYII